MLEQLKLRALLKDRKYTFALIGLASSFLAVLIISLVYIRPGELLPPIRYSTFDTSEFRLGQWTYMLNYVVFAIIVLVGHFLISAKLYQERGREFALGFVYLGTMLLIVAFVFFLGLYRAGSILR